MQRFISLLITLAIGISLPITAYASFCFVPNGCTGTSTTPNYGQLLIGGKNGEYEFVASSTIGNVTSVFGRAGAVTAQSGDYTTSLISEGSNLYYTLARWASALAGTTTDALAEGISNLYFTTARARGAISGTYPINYNSTTGAISTVATSSLSLTVSSFASPNISQWTNNAGYITSLSGAASSTLLADNNTWTGVNSFTNASSNFSGTWQTFAPSHFQVAGSYLTASPVATSTGETAGQIAYWTSTNGAPATLGKVSTSTLSASSPLTGSFVQVGSGGSLGIQAASASQNGYFASADYSLLHTASTTFSSPLVYTLSTNAVTCPTCVTSAASWPWTVATHYGTSTNATTTPTWYKTGVYASSTSQFVNASSSQQTIGNSLWLPNITSKSLLATDANGLVVASSTIGNAQLVNSTIGATSPNGTLSFGSAASLGSAFTGDINLANENWWTARQNFTNASTSQFTATSTVWFTGLTNALLATDSTGKVVATTSVGVNYLSGILPIANGGTGQSTFTSSQLVYGNGTNGLSSVATGTISASLPLSVTANRYAVGGAAAFSIADAIADGSTKGASTYTANDFDAASGVISLDYTNGQKATGSVPGFLSSADWTTFNSKNGYGWPWTTATNFASSTNSTTTPTWYKTGVYASSTSQFVYASTTALSATTLCLNGDTCRTTWPSGGGGISWPWTSATTYATTTNATTTPTWFKTGLFASSTVYITGTTNTFGNVNVKGNVNVIGNMTVVASTSGSMFIGSGNSLTTATSDTALGVGALNAETTGGANTAVGNFALGANVDGQGNQAFGYNALLLNVSGYYNSAFGWDTLRSSNSINGYNSAFGVDGLQNTTTGDGNTAIGIQAGKSNTTGSNNTYVGVNAGYQDEQDYYYANGTNITAVGLTNSTAIGYQAQVKLSNTMVLGNNKIRVGIGTSTPFWALTVASSTGPQLGLTDGATTTNAWTFRVASSTLYIATSTAIATSTTAALSISPSNIATFSNRLNALNFEGVRYANNFAGADIGAKANAAYANCPAIGCEIHISSGTYSFSTAMSFQTADKHVRLVCDGGSATQLTWTGAATSTILNTGTANNYAAGAGVFNCNFIGSGGSTSVGIQMGGSNGDANYTIRGNHIVDFGYGIRMEANNYNVNVENNYIEYNNRAVHIEEQNNSGENITFTGNKFTDCDTVTKCFYAEVNGSGSLNINDASFDDAQAYFEDGNKVTFNGGHFENPNQMAIGRYTYLVTSTGGYTDVLINGTGFFNGATTTAKSPNQYIVNGGNLTVSGVRFQSFDGISIPAAVNNTGNGVLTVLSYHKIANSIDTVATSSTSFYNDPVTGYVGIGTSTPAANLQLWNTGTNVQMFITRADGASLGLKAQDNQFRFTYDRTIDFDSDQIGTTRMALTTTGFLGIGTTTPNWQITAAHATKPQLSLVDPTSAATAAWTFRNAGGNFYVATSTYSATSSKSAISINTNSAFSVNNLVSCAGIQTSAAGLMSCTSDARLKDIKQPFTAGLSAILDIHPQAYSYKKGTDQYDGVTYDGFIAQDVQKAIPEAVNEGYGGWLQVSQTTILATVVNAIKDLAHHQDAQDARIAALEAKIDALQKNQVTNMCPAK